MDLEARLRRLKLADPAPELADEVRTAVRDARMLRIAWRTAAAAAVLALAVGLLPAGGRPLPVPQEPETETAGSAYPLLASRIPSEPRVPTLEARRRRLELELEGGLR